MTTLSVVNLKQVTNIVVEKHNEHGRCVHAFFDVQVDDPRVVNLSQMPLMVPGPTLYARRHLRRWLFDNRKSVPLQHEESCALWTVYDKITDLSIVGLGIVLPAPLAQRLNECNQHLHRLFEVAA